MALNTRRSPSYTVCFCVCVLTNLQELRGKFLIKGKRLNKLEATFAPEAAAADDTDVTEEEESNDEEKEEEEQSTVNKTSLLRRKHHQSLSYIGFFFKLVEKKEAETGEIPVQHGDLLQECPLPRL